MVILMNTDMVMLLRKIMKPDKLIMIKTVKLLMDILLRMVEVIMDILEMQ